MKDLNKIKEFFSKSLKEMEFGDPLEQNDPISMNEAVLVMDDTITPDMWDREKIKVGIESKRITNPFWFTKPHKIIDFNSILGMISFDHPAKQKLSLKWVNSFLKDNHKVDMSAEPEGFLSTKFAKSPSTKLKMNEGEEDVKTSFEKIMDLLRKESRNLSDDDSYALALKLKAWFNKNILDEAKVEVDDKTKFKLDLKHLLDKHVVEATKEEETEFHTKLDKLVHDTFGKRKGELEEVNLKQSKLSSAEYQKAKKLKDFKASDWKWNADEDLYTKVNEGEMEENMLSLDDQAKAYYLEKLKKGEIDKLPDNPKAAFLAQMTKDEIKKDRQQFRREQGLVEMKQRIFNKLKK